MAWRSSTAAGASEATAHLSPSLLGTCALHPCSPHVARRADAAAGHLTGIGVLDVSRTQGLGQTATILAQ